MLSCLLKSPAFSMAAWLILVWGSWGPASAARAVEVQGVVVDAATGQEVAARIYLQRIDDGAFHFVQSTSGAAAVPYDIQNWLNAQSVERHTTVPAAPFQADLPPGRYGMTVERGKEYFPEVHEFDVDDEPVRLRILLRRWINMADRGWYSGETHIHRELRELPVVVEAEDLNVAFPLTFWVTEAFTAPEAGDRNVGGEIPEGLIKVDATHVIWPRNTEYEIFSVGDQRHTLGALFVLNHSSVLSEGVPPWGPVIQRARDEGALFDLDKLDWPFSMTLPHATGPALYELANNHLWRTEFAFRDWNSAAPPYLQPPYGGRSGNERQWLHYTLGMYYTLLNAGFPLVPTAGTASGVHPVPVGFSRVYVHLPDGFSYDGWLEGLRGGRSFVTTGPMLLAQVEGRDPGETFQRPAAPSSFRVAGEVVSEQPLALLEVVVNGRAIATIHPQNQLGPEGQQRSSFSVEVPIDSSGWLCVRAFEDGADGRVRFAHTAPWWIEMDDSPLRPRREEKEYLVQRVETEIARSRGIVPEGAMEEYRSALTRFEELKTAAADFSSARPAKNEDDLRYWLENMVWDHRFSQDEIRAALAIDPEALQAALQRYQIRDDTRPDRPARAPLRVLPYPGGRHPRTGFLDGAIDPQRETKVSVFTPWDDASYVVVDVPEAIFSNLGLTYLAHTHVPTIWSQRGIDLPPLEWNRRRDGSLDIERELPNGITFGAKVVPEVDAVHMELWLRNGTDQMLTGLRVQNCVMLKAAAGFEAQTRHNKRIADPFVACHNEEGDRWIITAWQPCQRAWTNPPCPCLHSDPQFPDCPPGETRRVHGWLSFYEGTEIAEELERIKQLWPR